MARKPRKRSSTRVYHVMLRGINQCVIFEEDQDQWHFLFTLQKGIYLGYFKLYAYCLMDNHVHLLIEEMDDSISTCMKRISSSYVYWYNTKYERCGHLFQDRFKSEPVESIFSFLKVLRYIHQNPLKAGLVRSVDAPQWTSYQDYFRETDLIDTEKAFALFSNDQKIARNLFAAHMAEVNEDECLDMPVRIKDSEVLTYMKQIGVTNTNELHSMKKTDRNEILLKLKNTKGISTRQISRINGISKSVIGRLGTGTSSQPSKAHTVSKS